MLSADGIDIRESLRCDRKRSLKKNRQRMSQISSPQATQAVDYHTPITQEELEVGWVFRHIATIVGVPVPVEVKSLVLLYVRQNTVRDEVAAPRRDTTRAYMRILLFVAVQIFLIF